MNRLVRVGMDALEKAHWDGTGCGTHGSNACVYCFGPSPMSSYEIAETVIDAVQREQVRDQLHEAELIRDSIITNLRSKIGKLPRHYVRKTVNGTVPNAIPNSVYVGAVLLKDVWSLLDE